MYIQEVRIENFRALQSIAVPLSRISVLIGENDTGKSSFLYALDKFFLGKKLSDQGYWFKDNTKEDIHITLTFRDLPADELQELRRSDGTIMIHKAFKFDKPPLAKAILDDGTAADIPKDVLSKWFSTDRFHLIPVRRDLAVQFSMAKTALLGKTLRAQMKQSLKDVDVGKSLEELQTILSKSISEHRRTLESFLQEQMHDDELKLGFDNLEIDALEGVKFEVKLSDDRIVNVPIEQ